MSTDTALITADEFARMEFPDNDPVELVRGRIVHLCGEDGMVRPGPRHGVVCLNVGAIIRDSAKSTGAGWAVSNDSWAQTEFDPDVPRRRTVPTNRVIEILLNSTQEANVQSDIHPQN